MPIPREDPAASGGYSRTAQDLPVGETPAASGVSARTTSSEYDDKWILAKTQAIYTTSTDYRDTNIVRQWERSLAHFRGEHASGSRYKKDGFKRSATFRPKTRANVKAQEAAFTSAAFSTISVVEVEAVNKSDQNQIIAAAVTKAIMHYRLGNTIPWCLTAIGAYQNTKVYGICVGKVHWDYRKHIKKELRAVFNEDGTPVTERDEKTGEDVPLGEEVVVDEQVISDKPCVDLLAPENFRFDPMADWRDPANSSPYLIELIPMHAGDVLDMMNSERAEGDAWRSYDLAQILSTRKQSADRTRQAREGRARTDPADLQSGDEFTTVWVHFNVVREKGIDLCWYTLGTELVLTDVRPLKEEFPWLKAGKRPYRVGFSSLEAHRNHPAGDVEQGAPIQEEINDIANQRMDNVMLVLNKRYYIRRGSQVDLEALMRNVPGGGVFMNDPEKDVETVNTPDVTGSSYQEQDRLNIEFDELVGGFSQGSVLTNRKMNETVGGMDRVASAAGAVQDYGINIFLWTWYNPILQMVQELLAYYEDDQTVLAIAADQAQLFPRYGVNQITDELLEQDLVVSVNIGLGNTDPVNRVNRLVFAIGQVASLPGMMERVKPTAIADDVFGALGFKNANRHFMSDEEYAEKMANVPPAPPPPEIAVKMRELDIREADNQMRDARERENSAIQVKLDALLAAINSNQKDDDNAIKVAIAHMQNKTERDKTALVEANKSTEANLKAIQPPPEKPGDIGGKKE